MKFIKYFIFLLLAIPVAAIAQPSGSWPVSYGSSAPSYTPSSSGTRLYFNTATNELYTWQPAPTSSWIKYPKAFDQISGCAAPAYTPTARQSTFTVNSCTPKPELYQYTGSSWACLNCYTDYVAGTGIDITGSTISNTGDLSNTNELQTLSIVGQNLTLSNGGGTVTIPSTTTLDAADIVVDNSGFNVLTATDAQTVFEETDEALSNTLNTATTFSGDVSGTYDDLQLGTGVVGPTELASTAVTPGTYTNATVTFDADGRATSASSGTAPVTGSGTASYIPKWTGGTSLSSSIIYDNGTNIGIGTSSPTGIFHTYIPANTKGNLIEYNYQSGTSQRPFSLVNQDGLETVAFGANRATNEGRLFLGSPSVQGGGSGIDFQSNLGASSKIGRFDLDNSGNMIFRQSQGSMFYDYFSNVYFRDNAFTTRFQIYGADINIGTSFSSAARLVLYGKGTTSSTYSAQFHNSSGSSNTLIIRDDGLIGAGTNSPTSKVDILSTAGYSQLRLRTPYTPTGTADALGSTGDTAWDDNYFYIKTSAGWKRTALSTF